MSCPLPANLPPNSTHQAFYLGQPGAMVKLTLPDAGFTNALSRAEVAHALASGGTTTTRRKDVKRSYGLPWSGLTADTGDSLLSFYSGARGAGPYALVDPSMRNHMSLDSSTFGAPTGKLTAWSAGASDAAPYLDTAFVGPLAGSAVLHWPTPVATHVLLEGNQSAGGFVPSWTKGVPYLPDLPAIVSMWVRTVTGTASNFLLYALGLGRAGWDGSQPHVSVTIPTITTTWQQINVLVPVNSWSAAIGPIIAPALVATAGSPDILVSAAQLSYGFGQPVPWVTGLGCPRVSFSAPVSSSVPVNWRRAQSYVLTEV